MTEHIPVHAIGDNELTLDYPIKPGDKLTLLPGSNAEKNIYLSHTHEGIDNIYVNGDLFVKAQTRRQSLKESTENIFWGFLISGAINWAYISYALSGNALFDSAVMTAILTVTSFTRAYVIRRYNNWRQGC